MSDCILPEFVGVDPATLQLWLTQCQTALQQLSMGGKAETLSYTQGDGAKAVTYTRGDIPYLERRIRALAHALGLTPGRRAIGVRF